MNTSEMSISEIRAIIAEEFDLDGCVMCCSEKLWLLELPIPPLGMIDVMGIKWCTGHEERGQFINLMAGYDYPGVASGADRYRLQPGAWFTVQIALTGTDECLALLGAAVYTQREVA